MKILLIALNSDIDYTPLALLYLRASLLNDRYLKEKVEVEIKEFNLFDTDDAILYEIHRYNPQIIGFSCYVWNIQNILALSAKIKKIDRNTKIVLGGPQVSPIAKKTLEDNSQIDIVVKDEGEITFLELIKSLLNPDRNINRISGATIRDRGMIIDNDNREMIPDLDSIPSPHIFNLAHLKKRIYCLETQRGCIFKCHFCYWNKDFDKIRFFSMERVKKDLSFLFKQKPASIQFMDSVFNLNMNRAKEICRFIIQNNKNNISFRMEIKAEFVDEELAELFSKTNIESLTIGLQSSNDEVLHSVGRSLCTKKFITGLNLLKKYDLPTEIQLIFGLPGDTFHSFKKSLEFVLNLEPYAMDVFRLQVLPGTEIWRRVKELGIVYDTESPHYFLQTKSLPFDEVIKLQKILNSINLFKNKLTIKYLCRDTKIELLDMIELWVDWFSDSRILLNLGNNDVIKDAFRKFIEYFCMTHNIDFNFYDRLLQKEVDFSISSEKERIRRKAPTPTPMNRSKS